MKNLTRLFILCMIITSCATQSKLQTNKNFEGESKNYYSINDQQVPVQFGDKVTNITQVNFDSAIAPSFTQQVLFNDFGKWTSAQVSEDDNSEVLLIWNDITLTKGSQDKYHIIANGFIKDDKNVSSLMVYDKNGNDMLSKDSPTRMELIAYFSNATYDNNDIAYYEAYFKSFAPDVWDDLERTRLSQKDDYFYYNYRFNNGVGTNYIVNTTNNPTPTH